MVSEPLSRQVWFTGCHSDVGGGYPENESGLSKYPLGGYSNKPRCTG
ncbi:phospholipase effector Tle1 domain-containing protein (plasmid) [Rhizobium leguminosarum]